MTSPLHLSASVVVLSAGPSRKVALDLMRVISLYIVQIPLTLDKPQAAAMWQAVQNVEIEVHGKGGHAMAPPHDGSSVVARVSRLVHRVETEFPSPKLMSPTSDLLKTLGKASPSRILGTVLRNCDIW